MEEIKYYEITDEVMKVLETRLISDSYYVSYKLYTTKFRAEKLNIYLKRAIVFMYFENVTDDIVIVKTPESNDFENEAEILMFNTKNINFLKEVLSKLEDTFAIIDCKKVKIFMSREQLHNFSFLLAQGFIRKKVKLKGNREENNMFICYL